MEQTTATQTAPTPDPEQVLDRAQRSYAMALGWQIEPLDKYFILDHGLPGMVIQEAPKLELTLEEVSAALKCWRTKMIAAVDEIVARHMVEAKNLKPKLISWADNKELIFRLWSAYNQEHEPGYTMSSLDEHFSIFAYASGLGFTPEQIREALECWRVRLSEAVYTAAEKAAERYAANNPYNPSNP